MHSFGYRLNSLLTYAATILALMCAVASFSDKLSLPSPNAELQVVKINRFRKGPSGNDEVTLTLNIAADLRSAFTWNTKQVFVFVAAEYITVKNSLNQISLWDHIIPSRDRAILQTQTKVKYPLTDQGNHLRGKYFNLTLHWHVMPNVGRMIADKIVMPTIFSLPKEYH
ncbi:hypothetical protein AMTRI_Chr13g118590 [Amborella trichopoda]|uniref:signal peptidase complex subunit 3A n=1 Tax=Amborella trichopoda TaxID=13333 RepID=UPI0005D383CB|nr:signal peptidase complex subunit 3A [Amborella trichopoda]|eukprot:XP_011623728.1 signal peptidase complex subunit 3A [Amborella trichopoda]